MNEKQQLAFDKVTQERDNIFITGPGGTGKSFLIKQITQYFDENEIDYLLLSTTGVSACNVAGQTVHSAFKLGRENNTINDCINIICKIHSKYCGNKRKVSRNLADHDHCDVCVWKRLYDAQCIIIDEVSMLHARNLYFVDNILKYVTGNNNYYGGKQMVFVGDFFQLPPVHKPIKTPEMLRMEETDEQFEILNNNYRYVFETEIWKNTIDRGNTIFLDFSFRQQDDTEYAELLNRIRMNQMKIEDTQLLCQRVVHTIPDNMICLFSTKRKVLDHNTENLAKCLGPTIRVTASIRKEVVENYDEDYARKQKFIENCESYLEEELKLILDKEQRPMRVFECKLGARVMLNTNLLMLGSNLYNGRMGYIRGIYQNEETIIDETNINDEEITSKEILNLKANGILQFKVEFDPLYNQTETQMEYIPCYPFEYEYKKVGTNKVKQIPFELAWAVTIHKSQSQTLNNVVIDMAEIFEHGQAYTAFSRVTSMEGLYILRPDFTRFQVDREVLNWYAQFHQDFDNFNKRILGQLNLTAEQINVMQSLTLQQILDLVKYTRTKDIHEIINDIDVATQLAQYDTVEQYNEDMNFKEQLNQLLQGYAIEYNLSKGKLMSNNHEKYGMSYTYLFFDKCSNNANHNSMLICTKKHCYIKCKQCSSETNRIPFTDTLKSAFLKFCQECS